MAKRLLGVAASMLLVGAAPAVRPPLDAAATGQRLILDRVPFNVAAEALLRRVSSEPFLLCDVALGDKRLVSLRFEPWQLSVASIRSALGSYGYSLTVKGGVLYVCDGSERGPNRAGSQKVDGGSSSVAAVPVQGRANRPVGVVEGRLRDDRPLAGEMAYSPVGSPLTGYSGPVAQAVPQAESLQLVPSALVGYRPDYISPTALLAAVQPVFPDLKFSVVNGEGQRPALFASGPVEQTDRFQEMAKYLDRQPEAVEVQAIVLEVTDGSRTGFGVSFVLDALKSGVGLNVDAAPQGNQLTFHGASFDGVLSAVSGSSAVRVVSSPRLRGRSGEKMRLQVGSDVPTLGAVVENPSGSTQQAVQYRSSGVIFEVIGQVYGRRIGLSVHQELSAFASTETGVRGSPTLSTRELDTSLDLESGEWAVIGGLTASQDSTERQSLFGLVPLGKVRDRRSSELVLLINVRRVGQLAADQ